MSTRIRRDAQSLRRHPRTASQVQAARGFGNKPLYAEIFALASDGWKLLPHCSSTWMTQLAHPRGDDDRAVFGFPLELALESVGPPTSSRPPVTLFMSVMTLEGMSRHSQAR